MPLRLFCVFLLVIGQTLSAQSQPEQPAKDTAPHDLGYSSQTSAAQAAWEKKFQDGIVPGNIRENMRRLSARPHHVGSPYDKDNAEWILAKFKEWGFEAKIETFNVLFPTPKERLVELLEPTRFRAKLQEPALAPDPTSGQTAEQLPTYNAYSADGEVTAPLVYVNYGNREDYEQLDRLGISVKDAIVIARYGGGWRGIKPKVAGEHGAVGCIIYSDPKGDGFFHGDDYPTGGWRPREGVQRGSVMDTEYPGDPLTPGVGATADAKRLSIQEAATIAKIPVLPISYADALPLLSALQGPVAPPKWRGALAITYHVGPGPAKVHLKVVSNWDIKPIYDVIGTLRGSDDGQWVIRGNHHDAWVNGADDPISGQAPMLEEARMLGELHRQGWTPKRTIIYCAWDGEEPGLLGSVEWVETHLEELKKHAVAYLNSDSNERGYFFPGGTQDLQTFISGVARDIQDPETHLSVFQRSHLVSISKAKDADERKDLRKRSDLLVKALGDGSDFTAFQDLAGISTLSVEFGGEDDGDQYHSIYDDFYWYTHFADTDFVYGRALAQTAGTAMMRLADADLIPFDYSPQAEAIAKYEAELEKLLKDKQEEFTERNLQLQEGVFAATADPRKHSVPPPLETVPPFMNFAPMKNAIERLKQSSDRYSKILSGWQAKGSPALSAQSLELVNADLLKVPRLFLNENGLPERPWFKNQVYAPGAYTGYDAKPIAAVREYMDEKKWKQAEGQVPQVSRAIENVAAGINQAANDLEAAVEQAH
ncbi:MAG TPA: transferrin receptor-like dimerization domain-containing protein [Terriglobales bacterium]|jgi:N-acetylated-alpha-linked acidic dipeptidase|nr:transferrin receptor-like dimerization domain-containing protein [Terriglobales bacterium]